MARKLTARQRRTYRTRNKLHRVNILQNPNRFVRPRLSVHRTGNQIYAQIIDDVRGVTLASASTLDPAVREMIKQGGNIQAAEVVGRLVAERACAVGVGLVQFDRGAYLYHGRIKALAESARAGGLQF